MTPDWRELVTRDEDPEDLAGTEVDPPLGWGDDYEAFIDSLADEHPLAWLLEQPQISEGAIASGLLGWQTYKNKVDGAVA